MLDANRHIQPKTVLMLERLVWKCKTTKTVYEYLLTEFQSHIEIE